MVRERGMWQTFGERTVYAGRGVQVELVDVLTPSGAQFGQHVVHLPRIAIALIVNDRDQVLMLWRHRFATDQWGYELLGGLIEPDEQPPDAAAREALEESGWRPDGEPEHLIHFEPLPGQVTAPTDVYLWRQATLVGEATDTDEASRVEWVPLSSVNDLASHGQLLGAGTLVPLLYYRSRTSP